jgi:hypothetical protein
MRSMIRVATSPVFLSGPLAMLSADDRKMRAEVRAMRGAIADLLCSWTTLENSLAFLLSMMTAQEGTPGWQVGLAIYFAPNNFETRIKIVDTALKEWFRGAKGEQKAFVYLDNYFKRNKPPKEYAELCSSWNNAYSWQRRQGSQKRQGICAAISANDGY